jgi:hypothetical protein
MSSKGHVRCSVPLCVGHQSYQNFRTSFLPANVCTFDEKSSPLFRMGNNNFRHLVQHIYNNYTHYGVQVTRPLFLTFQ